ncbi:MAG: hypothetical protein KJO40_13605 [Deltaproteobacteria bacterium]|nr:hypothetical protein [Deltaproteobacteria bacterium]
MQKRDGGEKRKASADHYADFEPAPLPVAPDGGIAATGIAPLSPVPAATPRNMVCLRGPCRHYWELTTYLGSGNPADTWAELGVREPRQLNRSCLAHPGTETELTEDCAFDCNRWDPLSPREMRKRERRRKRYYRRHPDDQPLEELPTIAGFDDEGDD